MRGFPQPTCNISRPRAENLQVHMEWAYMKKLNYPKIHVQHSFRLSFSLNIIMFNKRIFNELTLNIEFISTSETGFFIFSRVRSTSKIVNFTRTWNFLYFLLIKFSLGFDHFSFKFNILYALHNVTSNWSLFSHGEEKTFNIFTV